jgi:uncharacterized protein YbjT (DUF2867 family)
VNVAVFGATGGTGRHLVEQALAKGHRVTAFARGAGTIAPRSGLAVVAGDSRDARAIAEAVSGQNAVLCALGGRPWRPGERVCSSAMRHIVAAMAAHGARRVVAISTFGAGDTRAHVGWLARQLLFGVVLRSEVADKEAMERTLAATDLDWTVVRVGLLGDGAARATWRAADDGSIRGMGRISRADVAAFMLSSLASDEWLRRKPVLMD